MSGLKGYAIYFKDGVEEMMRNASCYVVLFPIKN